MQIFGLISLLIAVSIGAVWMVSSMGTTEKGPDGTPASSTYNDAINSAHDAVNAVEKQSSESNSQSGKSITVYDGINIGDETTILNLSSRGLSGSLKAEIRHLSNLKELDISNNNFTGLPAEVGQLSRLEILNLSNNPFTGLPQELGNLKNLKVLDLRGTNYSKQDLVTIKQSLPQTTQVLISD